MTEESIQIRPNVIYMWQYETKFIQSIPLTRLSSIVSQPQKVVFVVVVDVVFVFVNVRIVVVLLDVVFVVVVFVVVVIFVGPNLNLKFG